MNDEEKATQEKVRQLTKVIKGTLSPQELSDIITERRVKWMREHLPKMLFKYKGLSLEGMAHRIIFLDHMGINPKYSRITKVSPTKIRIDSYNFCPYLEACIQLGLETRFVCAQINEQSIQKMVEMIHPSLKFGRNYSNIRPFNKHFCEEYIELTNS